MNESDFTRGREMVESQLGPLGVRLTREVGPTGEPPTLSTLAVEIQWTREHWPALSQLFAQWPAAKAPLDEFLRRRFDEWTRPKP